MIYCKKHSDHILPLKEKVFPSAVYMTTFKIRHFRLEESMITVPVDQ
ncbi:hypothetical protein C8N37_102305 [Sphingobacterium faecium]|nr:hypothetical protein C8N37_102305 [Sphingobacterium faecium]